MSLSQEYEEFNSEKNENEQCTGALEAAVKAGASDTETDSWGASDRETDSCGFLGAPYLGAPSLKAYYVLI